MIDTTEVQDLVSKLNYDWFKKKKKFFLNEGLYNKNLEKIYEDFSETEHTQIGEDEWKEEERTIVVDVDFNKYCWSSLFYGSNSYGLNDPEYVSAQFPVDSGDIADDIVTFIHKYTEKFTDVIAIDAVIIKVVESIKQAILDLQKEISDATYKQVLDDFVAKTRQELSKEFHHIKQQINLKKSPGSIDKKLSTQICSKLANFRVDNKKLISNVEGDLNEGDALLFLLTPGKEKKANLKIRIEDWQVKDVQYLLHKLSGIITDRIIIADIEKKKSLYLKSGQLFTRGSFDTFKSSKLDAYIAASPNKSAIDSQLASLF